MTRMNFHIDFELRGEQEATKLLVENIEHARKLKGWTRKRIYLMGAASMIGNENPALVMQIAEYIAGVSPKKINEVEPSES